MQPTDKFSLLVESQTRGEASINRLNDTLAKLSAVVAATNERTARSTESSSKRTTDAFKRTESGAQNLGQSINRFLVAPLSSASDALLSASAGAGKFAGAAAGVAVGVVGAAIGLKNFTQAASESAREIQSLSQATGLSINQSDKLRAAAVLTGFDIRNLKEAALDFSQALKDTSGEGQRVRDLLQKLGVAAYTVSGQTRPLNDVFLDTLDTLSKIEDTATRVNFSRVMGGEDAAKSIQPLLVQLSKANKEAESLGFGMREALVKSGIEANAEMRKFDLQWEALKVKLATGLTIPLKFINELSVGRPPGAAFQDPAQAASDELRRNLFPSIGTESLGRFRPQVPGIAFDDLREGQRLSDAFRKGQAGTETGLKARLEKLGQERGAIQQLLSSGNLGANAFQQKRKELDRLEAEQFEIETRLKFIDRAQAGQFLVIPGLSDDKGRSLGIPAYGAESVRSSRIPSLFGRSIDLSGFERGKVPDEAIRGTIFAPFLNRPQGVTSSIFQANTVDIAAANVIPGFDPGGTLGALQFQKDQRDRERNLNFVSQELAHQERKVELLTGPGGELAAINAIADLRHAALQQELDLGAEIFDLNERRLQIEEDRTLRILDLQRRRRDEARGLASDFVGSLQSRNVGGFFRNQGSQLLNQIGTNALAGPVNGLLSRFGSFGAASGFGGLLKGTLFDPQNKAIDANTAATIANTAALTGRGVAGGGLAIPGVPGVTFGDLYSGLKVFGSDTNGITGQGPLTASSLGRFDRSISLGNGKATTLGAIIGPAAAITGATFGAINGFKSGGVQGNLSGAASVAGGAAAAVAAGLLGSSAAAGPAAPIIAGVGLVLAAAASLIGNPKERRNREIDSLLNSSIYNEPTSMVYGIDENGYGFDTGRGGGYRSIVVNISAVDAKSFMDRRKDIGDAVRQAMIDGHGLNRTAREVVLAA